MRQDPERAADPGPPPELLAELAAAGYVHLRHPMTWESFAALARRLGTIVLQTDIKIDRERVSTALKPEELGFHNDNPEIGVIGWYCAEQDATGGASLLLDTAGLAASFRPRSSRC